MAAITRTLTCIGSSLPNRWIRRSCNTRKQLDLQVLWQFTDLVKKDRPAMGEFEAASPCPHRAGEGSLFVAEQLAFHQCFGKGRQDDRNERTRRPRTGRVNRPRQPFLADARFALNQQRTVDIGGAHRNQVFAPDCIGNLIRLTDPAGSLAPAVSHYL